MDGFKEFKTSMKEVTDVKIKFARELALFTVEAIDVTEVMTSHDKILTDEKLIFTDEQRSQFLDRDYSWQRGCAQC